MTNIKRAKVVYFYQPDAFQAEYGGLTKDLSCAKLYGMDEPDGEVLGMFENWQPDVHVKVVKITYELE